MGLWDPEALRRLQNVYNVRLVDMQIEALREEHVPSYARVVVEKWVRPRHAAQLVRKAGLQALLEDRARSGAHRITGHTVVAVFGKTSADHEG